MDLYDLKKTSIWLLCWKKNYEEKGFDQFIKRIESSIQFLFIECDFFKLFKRIF